MSAFAIHPTRRATAVVASTLALTLAACGSDQMPQPEATEAPVSVALEPAVRNDREGSPQVRVLKPGSGEKQVFTYSPALGAQPQVTVDFSNDSSVLVDGVAQTQPGLPERQAQLAQQVDADVDGTQRAAFTVQQLTPTVADTGLDELLASGRGFAVTYQRAADGWVTATTLEAPQDARNVARQSIEQLANSLADAMVVLPSEPIGEGAQWTVTQPQQDAVAPEMETTYTLRTIDGHSLILDVAGTANPTEKSLDLPREDGSTVTMSVDSYESKVSGELRVSLTESVPFSGRLAYETKARYLAPDGKVTETSATKNLKFS